MTGTMAVGSRVGEGGGLFGADAGSRKVSDAFTCDTIFSRLILMMRMISPRNAFAVGSLPVRSGVRCIIASESDESPASFD